MYASDLHSSFWGTVRDSAWGQGHTRVLFSAQPKPFLSLNLHETTQRITQKVLKLIQTVFTFIEKDECKPLPGAAPLVPRRLTEARTLVLAPEQGRG
jgi:hypothetical protein